MTEVIMEEWDGHPMIRLPFEPYEKDGREINGQFSFGIHKARLILKYIEDINKFVQENDTNGE